MPALTRARTTLSTIASKSFMSTAPRPQTQPSVISPEKGGTLQSSALAGTTSRWPWISNGLASGSTPSGTQSAIKDVRPGSDSNSWVVIPTSSSSAATCSAAARSPGPGCGPKLVVSIRIRSRQISTTSASGA